jgi:arginine decarboxylase
VLEVHQYQAGRPYYLAMFLVGAYQEILGDLHNLFGDTNAIHISMDEEHGYRIERVIPGDSVAEVLTYVQYDKLDLVRRMRSRVEAAVRQGSINMKESALLMKRYEEGLSGYTYLTDEEEGVELQPHPQAVEAPGETNGGRAHAQPAAPPPTPSSR